MQNNALTRLPHETCVGIEFYSLQNFNHATEYLFFASYMKS